QGVGGHHLEVHLVIGLHLGAGLFQLLFRLALRLGDDVLQFLPIIFLLFLNVGLDQPVGLALLTRAHQQAHLHLEGGVVPQGLLTYLGLPLAQLGQGAFVILGLFQQPRQALVAGELLGVFLGPALVNLLGLRRPAQVDVGNGPLPVQVIGVHFE